MQTANDWIPKTNTYICSDAQLLCLAVATSNKSMYWACKRALEYARLAAEPGITDNARESHLQDARWWHNAALRNHFSGGAL